jgi:excisionase family DNA binding protein
MSTSTTLLFRISDVMEMLSVSRVTVYRMIQRGDLKSVKIGSATRITAESVYAVLPAEMDA